MRTNIVTFELRKRSMLRKRPVAVAVVLTALLTPVAFGLGLGTLKTKSALNEPFEAQIPVVSASVQDFDSLKAKLADEAQFDRAGVPREAVLLNLRFEVVSSEAGADYIRVTTKDPVREPFLNFLLELNWAQGRLVREYTVLLDPPLYDRTSCRAYRCSSSAYPNSDGGCTHTSRCPVKRWRHRPSAGQ
jgi:pilus assembly protein FimV